MFLLGLFLIYAAALAAMLARAGFRTTAALPDVTSDRPGPARILIIGATGGTGIQLVTQALARGYAVTALVRNPSKLKIVDPQLTIIKGDVLDPASVAAAMRGQEAVVCALGHKRFLGPTRVLSEGTRNILVAMESEGVRRFVCETSLGLGDSAGRMGLYYTLFTIPLILPFYFRDKALQERIIAASGVDWVIVRPGALTNGGRTRTPRHGRGIGHYVKTVSVSRADVADFMLDQLTADAYLRAAPGVSR